MTSPCDVAVIGAGIVGLATARAIAASDPSLKIVLLEKENAVATHQTGRNSGVIHAGLYYEPGSLKARLCVEGGARLVEFCRKRGIPVRRPGKIIVATDASQVPALEELERRAGLNGVTTVRVGPDGIREHEPHATGVDGLWVATTGCVDFGRVARTFAEDLETGGAEVRVGAEVVAARPEGSDRTVLETPGGAVAARLVVNCAGLHVDRVAALLGTPIDVRILTFRGEYWSLRPEAAGMVKGNIYPVPDPRLPHLGVHFTCSIDDRVEAGPSAVWAWGREAYGRVSGNVLDAVETLSYPGFWALARRHWRTAAGEQWRSLSRSAFAASARTLLPGLTTEDLDAWRSGVRAQAVARDGSIVHDFLIREAPGVVNVVNAPSPAATSCLTIGEHIAAVAMRQLVH